MTQARPFATVSALGDGPTSVCETTAPEAGAIRTSRPPRAVVTVAHTDPAASSTAVALPPRVVVNSAAPVAGSIFQSRDPPASHTPSAPTVSRYGCPAGGSGTAAPSGAPEAALTLTSEPTRTPPGCTAHQSVPPA